MSSSVGIRELRQRASELIRLVEQGETIEITDRGRPVALLAPVPAGNALAQLRAAGEVSPARGSFEELPAPIDPPEGAEPPSRHLERLRSGER